MSIRVRTPAIHGVADITAQARLIEGRNGPVSMLTLVFTGPDGSKHEQDIFFEGSPTARAFDIEHAINQSTRANA